MAVDVSALQQRTRMRTPEATRAVVKDQLIRLLHTNLHHLVVQINSFRHMTHLWHLSHRFMARLLFMVRLPFMARLMDIHTILTTTPTLQLPITPTARALTQLLHTPPPTTLTQQAQAIPLRLMVPLVQARILDTYPTPHTRMLTYLRRTG